jgi:hypothetical protein
LTEEEAFFLDLNVIAKKERDSELKENEKVEKDSKSLSSYPHGPGLEGRMAEDQDIEIIFIPHSFPMALLFKME